MGVPDVSDRPLAELLSLGGRTAVVTGGGRGIGLATVLRLAEAGASVVVADLDEESARDGAALAADRYGGGAAGFGVDVVDPAAVADLADRAVEQFGGIDVWVNNAGVYGATPLFDGPDVFDQYVAVNLRGVFVGAREAARCMVAAGTGGVIVNVASSAAFRAMAPESEPYCATKAGVVGLTRALAVSLGPAGIRVLGIAPSLTRTPGIDELIGGVEGMNALLAGMAAQLPLGRTGVADDIARVILFCSSDLAMFMTGATLPVDAGELAH